MKDVHGEVCKVMGIDPAKCIVDSCEAPWTHVGLFWLAWAGKVAHPEKSVVRYCEKHHLSTLADAAKDDDYVCYETMELAPDPEGDFFDG